MPCKVLADPVNFLYRSAETTDRNPMLGADMNIRETDSADLPLIETLYPVAFPGEDLLPLVRQLLGGENDVLSLGAMEGGRLIGHVAFTVCRIAGADVTVALLAPLAVDPELQRRGVGTALVEEGFRRLRSRGIQRVVVLGDPAYYGRFGFEPDEQVLPPYAIPEEWRTAWQYVDLNEGKTAERAVGGRLTVPPVWQKEALWLP